MHQIEMTNTTTTKIYSIDTLDNNIKEKAKLVKIISMKVNSIVANQRRYNFLKLLEKENPDMVLLTETKVNMKYKIEFKKYNIIRNNRLNTINTRGTAILIKDNIKFKKISNNNRSKFNVLQATVIKIKINDKYIYSRFIVAVYSTTGKSFNIEFTKLFESLNLEKGDNFILVAGDFNAKHTNWKNAYNNSRGIFIKNWLIKLKMIQFIRPNYIVQIFPPTQWTFLHRSLFNRCKNSSNEH
jgi:exonuclease III